MKSGYTVPELLILIIVIGFFAVLAINKASYAFVDENRIGKETTNLILVKTASLYGESIKETVKEKKSIFISSNDVIEAGFLVDNDNIYKNYTIKLTYDAESDKINAEVV